MTIKKMISSSFIELASIESKYFRKKLFSRSLSCFSKKSILESYYEALEDFVVIFSGTFEYQQEMGDITSIKLAKTFRKKFENHMKEKVDGISCKMLILFDLLIEEYENLLFSEIDECFNTCSEKSYEKALNIIFDLAELAALILSGIRFSCKNLKDEIIDINPILSNINYNCDISCPFLNKGKECLHIIVTDETIKIPDWSDKLLNIFATYYKNPKDLSIFIDYKLVSKYEWNKHKSNVFNKYLNVFGGYYLVNVDNVDFKEWENDVDIVPFSHLSSCILP